MTFWQSIIPALFGRPGLFVSLGLAAAGLLYKSPRILLAGALVAVPLGLYLSTFGSLYSLTLVPVALYLAAPLLLRRDRARTAVYLVLPFFVTIAAIEVLLALQQ